MFSIVDKNTGAHFASFSTLQEACDAFAQYIQNNIHTVTIIQD